MKSFWIVILLGFTLLPPARAQEEADDKYITIYSLMEQAETLANAGEPRDALRSYLNAQSQLQRFQKQYPAWNPGIVNYRLKELAQKISALGGPAAAVVTPLVAAKTVPGTNAANAARLQAQVENLQSQMQSALAQNEALQAKLKEALAAQPAAIDASELARAQADIRWLMKENDLLKATAARGPEQAAAANTIALTQARQQLDAYVKKYDGQRARAEQLAAENEKLRAAQKLAAPEAATLAVMREENARLQALVAGETNSLAQARQDLTDYVQRYSAEHARAEKLATENAALQKDRTQSGANGAEVAKLTGELTAARNEIAMLKSSAAVASLEKTTLETKVRQLSTAAADAHAANYEARLRDLGQQRDDLLKKLTAAEQKNSRRRGEGVDTQMAALNEEMKTLRARLEADEAKPVPFGPEELALFRQATPAPPPAGGAAGVKKSIGELPGGSGELVASAQRHFARHEYDQAEADYQKILDRDQNNGLALANLATIELQAGKLAEAEKHLNAALAQSPDDAYNLSTLGYLKFCQEKYDDALNILSRAAKIDPENPEIQNYLGVTYSHKGLRLQAESALRKAIQINPLYAPAHNNLAVIYLTQTPPSPMLARWHYQKAVTAGQPRNPDLEKLLAEKGAPVDLPQKTD